MARISCIKIGITQNQFILFTEKSILLHYMKQCYKTVKVLRNLSKVCNIYIVNPKRPRILEKLRKSEPGGVSGPKYFFPLNLKDYLKFHHQFLGGFINQIYRILPNNILHILQIIVNFKVNLVSKFKQTYPLQNTFC